MLTLKSEGSKSLLGFVLSSHGYDNDKLNASDTFASSIGYFISIGLLFCVFAWLAPVGYGLDRMSWIGLAALCGFFFCLKHYSRADLIWLSVCYFSLAIVYMFHDPLPIIDGDAKHYVRMVREGLFAPNLGYPFGARWLTPLLAGKYTFLPFSDLKAIEAINFSATLLAGFVMTYALRRASIKNVLILSVCVALYFYSYLSTYGALNRWLTDPINYLVFALMFYCLLIPSLRWHLTWILALGALNTEKVVLALPTLFLIAAFDNRIAWRLQSRVAWFLSCATAVATVFFAIRLTTHSLEVPTYIVPLHLDLVLKLSKRVWCPYIFATLFWVIYLIWKRNRFWILYSTFAVPLFAQCIIAADLERMVAYSFVIVIPALAFFLSEFLKWMASNFMPPLAALLFASVVALMMLNIFIGEWRVKPHIALAGTLLVWLFRRYSRVGRPISGLPL